MACRYDRAEGLRLGGADSGKIGEACVRIEGQDGPVCLYGVSGDNQVMCAAWRFSPPGMRDQPRVQAAVVSV